MASSNVPKGDFSLVGPLKTIIEVGVSPFRVVGRYMQITMLDSGNVVNFQGLDVKIDELGER